MIQQSTIEFIKKWEGVKYKAYKDVIGLDTIGVGHLIKSNEKDLLIKTLTEQEVDDLLRKDLKVCDTCIVNNVKVPLLQTQFDALASFIFNLGIGAFGKSTLLKKVNLKAPKEEISVEFKKWNKAGGKEVKGLTLRREAEANLFNKA